MENLHISMNMDVIRIGFQADKSRPGGSAAMERIEELIRIFSNGTPHQAVDITVSDRAVRDTILWKGSIQADGSVSLIHPAEGDFLLGLAGEGT